MIEHIKNTFNQRGIVYILYDLNFLPEFTRLCSGQRLSLLQDAIYTFVIHHLKPGNKGSILVEVVGSQVVSAIHEYSLIPEDELWLDVGNLDHKNVTNPSLWDE